MRIIVISGGGGRGLTGCTGLTVAAQLSGHLCHHIHHEGPPCMQPNTSLLPGQQGGLLLAADGGSAASHRCPRSHTQVWGFRCTHRRALSPDLTLRQADRVTGRIPASKVSMCAQRRAAICLLSNAATNFPHYLRSAPQVSIAVSRNP